MPHPDDVQLLRRAVGLGYVSEPDAARCFDALAQAERSGRPVRLAQLLLERRVVTSAELLTILRPSASPPSGAAAPPPLDEHALLGELARSTASTPLAPGERLGGYELQREIARGGMGVLFEARAKAPGRPPRVAIKVLSVRAATSSSLVQRFRQEARLAASIDHPNVIRIHEVGQDRGAHYIVMDYFEGRSLADLLRNGTLAPKKALAVVATIAHALQHVHALNVIHRDVKPANVLVGTGGRAVITDFGLAKDYARTDVQLTQMGVAIGTPAYMAPEQARGDLGAVGPWSDVYALGAMLYRALSGQYPHDADSFMKAVASIATEEPIPLLERRPDCPPELAAIVTRAMAIDPRDRPSAEGLAQELDAYLAKGELAMPPAPANPKV